MTNWELLRAVRERGLTQRDFARLVGEHESVVSRVINGIWNPRQEQKIRYAKALRRKPEDLFQN